MVTSKAKRAAPAEPAMRERIVRESTRLFSERGFDGTTLQDIAAAVKVTKPAVLHHFPSKEHVLRAVLGEIVAHWEATLPRLLLAATAGESRFDTVLGAVYRFFAEDPERTRVVLRHALDRPKEARALLRDKVRLWVGAIATYIRQGSEKGLHPEDVAPDAYVLLVLELIIVAAASWDTMREALPERERGREVFDKELFRIARSAIFTEPKPRGDDTKAAPRRTNGPPKPPAKPKKTTTR